MAQYQGKKVSLGKPFRTPNTSKKFAVYVRDRKTSNIKKVRFGDPSMSIKSNIPSRKRSFMARMGGVLKKVKGQKNLSPAYWSLYSWRNSIK
tara:strand:+ start:404 stop:679 length:276 start_codon:yes stop_codon:yes gene_type:complete